MCRAVQPGVEDDAERARTALLRVLRVHCCVRSDRNASVGVEMVHVVHWVLLLHPSDLDEHSQRYAGSVSSTSKLK